jgi:MFS family permease
MTTTVNDELVGTKEEDGAPPLDLGLEKEAFPPGTEISYTIPDPNIVSWDGSYDSENPTNWPKLKRWTLITLVTAVTLVAGLSSSIFAPGVPALMKEFGSTNETLGSFVVTIYVLGLATGPIFFAPLSELYGRLPIQHVGNIGFLVWTIACALATSLDMLIVFRLIQGIFAAVPLTNGGGVIADTVRQEERGFALAMFTFGLLAGMIPVWSLLQIARIIE